MGFLALATTWYIARGAFRHLLEVEHYIPFSSTLREYDRGNKQNFHLKALSLVCCSEQRAIFIVSESWKINLICPLHHQKYSDVICWFFPPSRHQLMAFDFILVSGKVHHRHLSTIKGAVLRKTFVIKGEIVFLCLKATYFVVFSIHRDCISKALQDPLFWPQHSAATSLRGGRGTFQISQWCDTDRNGNSPRVEWKNTGGLGSRIFFLDFFSFLSPSSPLSTPLPKTTDLGSFSEANRKTSVADFPQSGFKKRNGSWIGFIFPSDSADSVAV